MRGPLGSGTDACLADSPLKEAGEEGRDEGMNLDHNQAELTLQSHLLLCNKKSLSQIQIHAQYLMSCWGPLGQPRAGGVGVEATGRVVGSWKADGIQSVVLTRQSCSGYFHFQLQGTHRHRPHMEHPRTSRTGYRRPPHGSSDTLLEKAEL